MPFSDSDAIKLPKGEPVNFQRYLDLQLKDLAEKLSLKVIMICFLDKESNTLEVVACHNLASAPFQKTRKKELMETVDECFTSYAKPHIHSVKIEFIHTLEKLSHAENLSRSVIFIPIIAHDRRYIFLGFSDAASSKDSPRITEEMCEEILGMINPISLIMGADDLEQRLLTLELYAKEVGHDIASAVQAIVSKLRNVIRGYFEGESALRKIGEAEEEIMSAYRIAENLGIVVDPDYNIVEGEDFNLVDAAKTVIKQYRSKASERHIEFRLEVGAENNDIIVWGDRRAIESAIAQYVFNAVKYSRGGSYIRVIISQTEREASLLIINFGMPLHEEERDKIWNFGFRGKEALERHVNGSGIGLFTVKKIISAHGGRVSAESSLKDARVITFSFNIPKGDLLKKSKLIQKEIHPQ